MKSFDITRRAKAKMLGISYEKYKQLESDFFGEDEEKKVNAGIEMAVLMEKASERINRKKGNKYV